MVVSCVVPTCKANGRNSKGLSFHEFPSDEKIRLLWLRNINTATPMGSWTINQYTTVCEKHFDESDYKPTARYKKVLKPDAVPTIFMANVKELKSNVTHSKRKRKASFPKKTPNKGNISSDENLMDVDNTSVEQDQVDSEDKQDQSGVEEQDPADSDEDRAGSSREQDAVSDREHNETYSDAEQDQDESYIEHGIADSDVEHGQADSEAEKNEAGDKSEEASKRVKVDPASESFYKIASIKPVYTPKHLKSLIKESKIKCAEKKLALVKEKLASKVVSRALQKALVVSKIKAENAKMDFYERRKIFLLQSKISHLKNEVPVSEENFQTLEYLQSKIMEEELATRIEERALQKQLFEAEIQASNEKQTYYVTKKTWLPIFMDHSNIK